MGKALSHFNASLTVSVLVLILYLNYTPEYLHEKEHSVYLATYGSILFYGLFVSNVLVAIYYVEGREMNRRQKFYFWMLAFFIFLISSILILYILHQGVEAAKIEQKKTSPFL